MDIDNNLSNDDDDNDVKPADDFVDNFDLFAECTSTDHIIVQEVQKGLPSILENNSGMALLQAPRTVLHHRLPPSHFRIALCRRLRLPIHRKQ
eukprot:11139685-Ditylum_brightwellii.AAC.1